MAKSTYEGGGEICRGDDKQSVLVQLKTEDEEPAMIVSSGNDSRTAATRP